MATYYLDAAVGNDSNAGTSAGSGNAWATLGKAISTMTGTDICHVKASAVYNISSDVSFVAGTGPFSLQGYTSSPGDGGQATLKATAAVNILKCVANVGSGYVVVIKDFIFDGNSGTGTTGLLLNYTGGVTNFNLFNCVFKNFTSDGFSSANFSYGVINLFNCTSFGNGGNGFTGASIQNNFYHCIAKSNTGIGFVTGSATGGSVASRCLSYSNGAGGFKYDSRFVPQLINCVAYGNTGDGFFTAGASYDGGANFINNISYGNTGYGFNVADYSPTLAPWLINCAYGGNGTDLNPSTPLRMNCVTLTGDPFTNGAGEDFTLNNTAGAGAACRGVGTP